MIVSLAEIKEWVRANNDDETTLEQLIEEAEEELKVTGKEFTEENKLAVQFCKFYVTYWFDNRDGTNYETYCRIKSSMLTKLTYSGEAL
jgi:hypothetical protein